MITVFTSTYNRAYILPYLYESLKRQTFQDFEWIIVDDGSTDETKEIVAVWINKAQFPIRYIYTKNGGKHRAINKGLKVANGELFFIVDSDDSLTDTSLERINYYFQGIKGNPNYCGLSGLRISPEGKPFDLKRKFDTIDCSEIEIRKFLGGDRAQIYLTDILRQYPFPEFEGENFISEGIVWSRMAQKYKVRFFNEGIYIAEYLSDGLTKNIRKKHRESPCGSMLMFKEKLLYDKFYIEKIKAGINYWRSSIGYRKKKEREVRLPWWGYLFYPAGLFFYYYDIINEKIHLKA